MEAVGIICEYNPFHNGHLYHIKCIKKMYPDSVIVLVMGGNFLQRGDVSIINKWDKARLSLMYGVDIVVELPFHFATQSSDIFAHGAISILHHLGVSKVVFGSESNDIKLLSDLADIQINNVDYNKLVQKYLDEGINYPTAMSRALKDLNNKSINKPNDLLALSYIKEIKLNGYDIKPISIKRTNSYHSHDLTHLISSATSIRDAISNNIDISQYVPNKVLDYINYDINLEKYFPLLKYKIISDINCLDRYQTVDEGLENRIKKVIYGVNSYEDLIFKLKTKRYTYNKIKRMLIHILCGFTKEEAIKYKDNIYIRLLGFNDIGSSYLNDIKKDISIPVISNFSKGKDLLDLEFRVNAIYSSIFDESVKSSMIDMEYKCRPIMINKNKT